MWQIGEAVRGIGDACRALNMPITGGNVSLYNETEGRAIFPTPVLGVVGILEDASKTVDARRSRRSVPRSCCWAIIWVRSAAANTWPRMHNTVAGKPPVLDLKREAALQKLIIKLIRDGCIESAHDCSEGGLAIALAECTFDSGGLGVSADVTACTCDEDAGVFGQRDAVRRIGVAHRGLGQRASTSIRDGGGGRGAK